MFIATQRIASQFGIYEKGTAISSARVPRKIMEAWEAAGLCQETLEDDAPEDEADTESDHLDSLSRTGLKQLIKDQGLNIAVNRSWSDGDIRDRIREKMGERKPQQTDPRDPSTPDLKPRVQTTEVDKRLEALLEPATT